jgi:hypothetical protein
LPMDVSGHTDDELEDATDLSLSRVTWEGLVLRSREQNKLWNRQHNSSVQLLLVNW